MIQEALQDGQFSTRVTKELITLLFKQAKKKHKLGTSRPITLVNVTYNIYVKAL